MAIRSHTPLVTFGDMGWEYRIFFPLTAGTAWHLLIFAEFIAHFHDHAENNAQIPFLTSERQHLWVHTLGRRPEQTSTGYTLDKLASKLLADGTENRLRQRFAALLAGLPVMLHK